MAREVSLNSLQELEREVILQVLYRDQAVQNIEEERIRYAVLPGAQVWGLSCLPPTATCLLAAACVRSARGP